MNDSELSLGFVVGLIKSIATKIAIQYEAIGITGVESTANALVFHFTPPTPDSVVPYTYIMSVANYVNETGTGTVRNANKLNEQTADFYTSATNINYNNLTSGLQSTTVQNAIGEIVNLLNTQLAKILTNETNILALQANVGSLNTEVADHDLTMQNIIKGEYVSSSGYIGIDKDVTGIIINSDIIDNMLDSHENSIGSMITDIAQNTTSIANNYNEMQSHFVSTTPHSGILERVINKGVANGYAPLNSDGKVPNQYLVLPASHTSYLLAEQSTVTDPVTGVFYRQRCSSTTDPRYSSTTQTISRDITATAGTWQTTLGSVTDPNTVEQVVNGLVSMTALVINVPSGTATINGKIEFYKRSGSIETLIRTSTENVLNLTTSPTTYYFNTQLGTFSLAVNDLLVVKVLFKKSLPLTISTRISTEGTNGTNTIFSGLSLNGGGGTTVTINDVIGLNDVFNGNTAITDIQLTGETFSLKDTLNLLNPISQDTVFVSSYSANGDGSKFTPYNSLKSAFSSITITKNNIEVVDVGTYNLPTLYTTINVDKFYGAKASLVNDLKIERNNAFYKISDLTGNLTIIGNDCTVVIDNVLNGNIILMGTNAKLIISNWDDTTYTITNQSNIKVGSRWGKFYNGVAI